MKIEYKVYMIVFVDDTSSSTNNFLQPTQILLGYCVKISTNDTQKWNNAFHATGGVLNEMKYS